jgi:hypothetical protein
MSSLISFVAVGSATALIVEFFFNIAVTGDYGNFLFTLVGYPAYLTLFFALQQVVLRRVARGEKALFVLTYLAGGVLGLAIEWFIIGNSPWGNPDSIQWGMWVFWAAVVSVPAIYVQERGRGWRMLWSLLGVYGGVSLALWLILPPPLRLVAMPVWMTVFYTYLHLPYLSYLQRLR